ncbi:CtrA inhibitor SciP [Thermaurantiacus sp.]
MAGGREAPARPASVPGPGGTRITLADLPPPTTTRWVVRRKAEVLAAVNGGLLTASEACARYGLSPEELELWQQAVDRAGVPGLRVTRIQLYRELDRMKRPAGQAAKMNSAPSRTSFPA